MCCTNPNALIPYKYKHIYFQTAVRQYCTISLFYLLSTGKLLEVKINSSDNHSAAWRKSFDQCDLQIKCLAICNPHPKKPLLPSKSKPL